MSDFFDATVLIVDDEKNTREGLRRSFEDEFDVYIAADIAGAMEILKSESVDVMVTDLRLGGEDGRDLIEAALGLAKPPVCILMTAYGSVYVFRDKYGRSVVFDSSWNGRAWRSKGIFEKIAAARK